MIDGRKIPPQVSLSDNSLKEITSRISSVTEIVPFRISLTLLQPSSFIVLGSWGGFPWDIDYLPALTIVGGLEGEIDRLSSVIK
jgi:hypothetical protein